MKRVAAILVVLALSCKQEPAKPAAEKKTADTTTATVVESTPRTEVGDLMPPYSATYLDGKPFTLAPQPGTLVLVNVWATWCLPCRMEIPELKALDEKYRRRGFQVVGVSVDDTGVDPVKEFVAEQKIGYKIAIDADGKLANILQTTVLPTSVMVDGNRRIVWRQVGALMPNEIAGVEDVIKTSLGLKKTAPAKTK